MPYRFKPGDKVLCRTGATEWSPGVITKLDYREPGMPFTAPYQVALFDGALIFVPKDTDELCKSFKPAWWEALFENGVLKPATSVETLQAMLKAGKDPNVPDILGDTLLLSAIRSNWTAGVSALIGGGADPNMGGASDVRPLHLAVKRNRTEMLRLLLDAKADPNLQDKDPKKEHDRKSVTFEEREWHRTPLHYAAMCSKELCAELLDARADPNVPDGQHKQPLHLALEVGDLDIAEVLLQKGAHVDAGNSAIGLGTSPLVDAAYQGNLEQVDLLLRLGAKVDLQGKQGMTALHVAARGKHAEVAARLLEARADVNLRATTGKTPAELAQANGATEIAALLGGTPDVTMAAGEGAWKPVLDSAQALQKENKLFEALQQVNSAGELLAAVLGLEASKFAEDPVEFISGLDEKATAEQKEALRRATELRGDIFVGLGAVKRAAQDYAAAEQLASTDELKQKRARLEKDEPAEPDEDEEGKVPCSILTGFLGSGKTTLLNHILREKHGRRIAVIENEFGEVGIDDALVRGGGQAAEENIVEMNNGCICCTIRGDLVAGLRGIFSKAQKQGAPLDGVLIETTGLADPAPVAQTFYADDFVQQHYELDGIITLVDARHLIEHLDEEKPEGVENEAVEQIAFADRLLLNKCDLADEAALAQVETRIREINKVVPIKRTVNSIVDMDFIMGIKAFSLDKILKQESSFLEDEQDHQHDNRVSSVGVDVPGEVDEDELNAWISVLLKEKGADLFRSKGVLAVKGKSEKFVFQAIHMLFAGTYGDQWKPMERRRSRMIFIGKNLDRDELTNGFKACLA